MQTGDAVRRQEASTRGVGDDVMKHHVNAIIEDDFWQVVKEEKLKEGDFKVESYMILAVHIVVDRRQERNIDRWNQMNNDRYILFKIDR